MRAKDVKIIVNLTGRLEHDWVWFDSIYHFAVRIAQEQNQTRHVRIGEIQHTKRKIVFRVDVLDGVDL